MKKIVVIGGGTGTFTVLSGLKRYPNVDLTAIVSMADSGGSNRVLRDDFGLLPTSDLRQCLVALAGNNGDNHLWRKLFSYRYTKGVGISGMTFGNLFMAALTDVLGSQEKAIEKTAEILQVKGSVIPVSYDDIQLLATYSDGDQVVGEHFIDEPKENHNGKLRIKKLSTVPKGKANSEALEAISGADMIVLGPGDLYTSILANVVIGGIPEAICESKAKVVYIVNLMTKWGQTYGMGASDHVVEMERYIVRASPSLSRTSREQKINDSSRLRSKNNRIDSIIVNSGKISGEILSKYKKEQAEQVRDDLTGDFGYRIIRADLVPKGAIKKTQGDILRRSLVRHDAERLAKVIMNI